MKKIFPVLLGEDEENDIFFVQRAFKEAQIPNLLIVVRDGRQVVEYLSGTGKYADRVAYPMPGLLILDLKMPQLTGLEVLQWLSAHPTLSLLPSIVWSSSINSNDVNSAYACGANAFITKPSSMTVTTELTNLIKGFWLGFNQPPDLAA